MTASLPAASTAVPAQGSAPLSRAASGQGRPDQTIPMRRSGFRGSGFPVSIRLCVRLMYLGAGLSVLAALAEVQAHGAIRAALVQQNTHSLGSRLSPTDITDAANFTVTFMVGAACLSAVLWLLVGWGIALGSRRARMIGTVLAVLCILKVYGTLTQGGASTLGILIDLLQLPVACAVTVLAWSGRSACHFRHAPASTR
ncbi:MAG: hypothetical protein M3Y49_20560 [Actinomycetota bacterium]|nr:hypothetical protein [Actinomycetota bacterium]